MKYKAPTVWMILMLATAADAQSAAPAQTTTAPQTIPAPAPAPVREPDAISALEKMGTYLRTLTTFQVHGEGSTEEVYDTGQKIQLPGTIDLLVTRPNQFRADLNSTLKRRQYFYDGKTLTIFAPRMGFYSVVAAPGTIKEVVDVASERLGLVLPMADLFQLGVDPQLTSRITAAAFVSTDVVGDQVCNHYAYRQPGVDWQMWIRDGAQPLPCKWVITSTSDPAQPSYDMRVTWNLSPTVPAQAFTFVPPEGADRISIAAIKQ